MVFHDIQYGGRDTGHLVKVVISKISHRDLFEPFRNVKSLIGAHVIARVNGLKIRRHFQNELTYDTDAQKRKRCPCGFHRTVALFKRQKNEIYRSHPEHREQ